VIIVRKPKALCWQINIRNWATRFDQIRL